MLESVCCFYIFAVVVVVVVVVVLLLLLLLPSPLHQWRLERAWIGRCLDGLGCQGAPSPGTI